MKLLTAKNGKWAFLWLTTWGVVQLLWGGDPLVTPPLAIHIVAIFLLAIVATFTLFPEERKIWFAKLGTSQALFILLAILVYMFLDDRSLIASSLTSIHVLFQQFMIAVLVFMVPSEKFISTAWRVLFLFGASHVLLILFLPWQWTLLFSVLASLIAVPWTFLIQRYRYGIALSFFIHLLFYLILFQLLM